MAFDNASNTTGTNQSETVEWTHTVNTLDDTILVIGISWRNSGASTATVNSVTYNDVACTLIRKDEHFNSESRSTALYYILNPSSGANTAKVTFSAQVWRAVCGGVSLTDINQTNPINVHTGQSGQTGTAVSTNITPTVDNTWIMDTVISRNGSATSTAAGGQTERWDYMTGSSQIIGSGSTKQQATAALTSMGWTLHSGTSGWSHSVVALAPNVIVSSQTHQMML